MRRSRRRAPLILIAGALAIAALLALRPAGGGESPPPEADLVPRAATPNRSGPPNVVVVMTDDQALATMSVMENARTLLRERGAEFANSFVSYALCCPARATFFTGLYAHNHEVFGTRAPPEPDDYALVRERMSAKVLPIWLQRAGYVTAHVGKWLHGYGDYDPAEPPPPGWSEWYAPLGMGSLYSFTDYVLSENGTPVRHRGRAGYQTDVFTARATDFIARRAGRGKPFFLSLAYVAPHRTENRTGRCALAPEPARRHKLAFADAELPDSPSVNEADNSDKPRLIRKQPPLSDGELRKARVRFQCQLESLLAVDEGLREIHDVLAEHGVLDDTVVIYTSDNGLLQGEHRFVGAKLFPYDSALRVPLLIAGPGVPAGEVVEEPVQNVDLAPTILQLAGAGRRLRAGLDGRSLVPLLRGRRQPPRDLLFEGYVQDDGTGQRVERLFSSIRRGELMYTEWRGGDAELYDLETDPAQLESRHRDPAYGRERAALAEALAGLRDCSGRRCRAR